MKDPLSDPVPTQPTAEGVHQSGVVYLSDDWLGQADLALNGLRPLPDRVVIGYRISADPVGTGDPDRAGSEGHDHHLVLGPDRVTMGPGLDRADLVLTMDWDLAVAIHRGTTGAKRAVLDGRITISGDPGALLGHQAHLAEIDDRLADLRARTVYR
jgi:hypothetical protein